MKKLGESFYHRADVVRISRELLGKILVTRFDGLLTAGRIVETEAYRGVEDRASHAFGGRRTARTEVMFGSPGTAYVYLCYGLHHLFNVVTNKQGIPHAILVRALEPLEGIPVMLKRTGKKKADFTLTRGPGNLSRAMGLNKIHSGNDLHSDELFIADDGFRYAKEEIVVTTRIGVDYAGPDAELPYRFIVKGNPYVSARKS
ncbi:MAG TPA: DNA-3-methyladenine glycosylase [Puia sp.]|nr:DNA-3-methyladenine glycosylase [Puia sp.]